MAQDDPYSRIPQQFRPVTDVPLPTPLEDAVQSLNPSDAAGFIIQHAAHDARLLADALQVAIDALETIQRHSDEPGARQRATRALEKISDLRQQAVQHDTHVEGGDRQ